MLGLSQPFYAKKLNSVASACADQAHPIES